MLDEMLLLIGLTRQDIYIANVLNCRPHNNRDPRVEELKSCRDWLDAQMIEIPFRVVVAMGRYASLALCPEVKPKLVRGTARSNGGVIEYFTLHPAAVLHNPHLKPVLEREFEILGELVA